MELCLLTACDADDQQDHCEKAAQQHTVPEQIYAVVKDHHCDHAVTVIFFDALCGQPARFL